MLCFLVDLGRLKGYLRLFFGQAEFSFFNIIETDFWGAFCEQNAKFLNPLKMNDKILEMSPFRDYIFSYTLRFESVEKNISP